MQTVKPNETRPKTDGYYDARTLLVLRSAFAAAQLHTGLATKFATFMFYVPRPHKPEGLRLEGMAELQVACGEKLITCYQGGSGPTVLLVHGWESSTKRLSALAGSLLTAGFRVVTFDLPAHGKSPGKETDIVDITNVILELERKCGPFTLAIAHSYGGVSLANAIRRGLSLCRAVFISAPASYEMMIARFMDTLGAKPRVRERFRSAIERRYAPYSFERDFNTAKNVGAASVPTLIIHDRDDPAVPFEDAVTIAGSREGVQLFATEKLGHNRILRDPSVARRCIQFFHPLAHDTELDCTAGFGALRSARA